MPGRDTCLGWPAAIGALALFACCGAAMAQGTPPPPAVSVIPVASRQVTETGEFLGRVTAINKVDIVARVAGFIEQRNFTEGQKVKTGDLLFRLEQATYKAAVEQQRANLAKAKATAVNTALQLQRGQELVRNQNIPQSTLDQRAADDAAAQAEVMQAQALLDQAQINLGYTEIRSPIDGRIGLADLHRRQPGQSLVREAGDDRQPGPDLRRSFRRASAMFSNTAAGSPSRPTRARMWSFTSSCPTAAPIRMPGLSNFLDVQVDPTTDTVAVRAQMPNPDGVLIPGGIVGVTVERGAPRSALIVPQSAVLLDQAGRYVLVVDADEEGRAAARHRPASIRGGTSSSRTGSRRASWSSSRASRRCVPARSWRRPSVPGN